VKAEHADAAGYMKAEVGQVNVSCGATAESAPIVPAKATVGEVMATTQHHGHVKSFSRVTGYGFILRDNENDSDKRAGLFFHVSAIANNCRPAAGDEVTFAIAWRNGRNYATNVQLCD
jgi:cold shock CspA family protein